MPLQLAPFYYVSQQFGIVCVMEGRVLLRNVSGMIICYLRMKFAEMHGLVMHSTDEMHCAAAVWSWTWNVCCRWVFAPVEFLKFNLLAGQSRLYGSHPWYWNISQGFPAITGTFLPLILLGAALSKEKILAYLAACSISLYSLAAHKEFRFLLPALQLTIPYCGQALSWLFTPSQQCRDGHTQPLFPGRSSMFGKKSRLFLLSTLFVPQILAALYFSLIHHRYVMPRYGLAVGMNCSGSLSGNLNTASGLS